MMKTLEATVTVNNTPDYAKGMYIVATWDAKMGQYWFFGAWESEEVALKVAQKERKVVVRG